MVALARKKLSKWIVLRILFCGGVHEEEYHPEMPLWTCDTSGCSKESKSVVLDANWRWLHNGQYTNCRLERLSLSWKLSGQEGSAWKANNLFGKDKIWRNDKLVRWVCCQLVCAYLFCIWLKVQGYDTVHKCRRHHASEPCPVLILSTGLNGNIETKDPKLQETKISRNLWRFGFLPFWAP